jgi:hypothetical protein
VQRECNFDAKKRSNIYIANNPALPMLNLSHQYLLATSESQKSLLVTIGRSLMIRGEDFTPGFFMGFFFQHLAGLMISLIMLCSKVFSKATAYFGILGYICMFIFLFWATFIPYLYSMALLFSMVGGILLMLWYVMIALRLFKLSSTIENA